MNLTSFSLALLLSAATVLAASNAHAVRAGDGGTAARNSPYNQPVPKPSANYNDGKPDNVYIPPDTGTSSNGYVPSQPQTPYNGYINPQYTDENGNALQYQGYHDKTTRFQ